MITLLMSILTLQMADPLINAHAFISIQNDPLKPVVEQLFDGQLSQDEIIDFIYILRVFGDQNGLDSLWLMAVGYHESRFNCSARRVNRNGSNDLGLYQHNSAYWSGRLRQAISHYSGLYGPYLFERIRLDRLDPVCSLLVTICQLKHNRERYNLHGIYVYLSHYGVGWATRLKYRSNAVGYRRALQRAYDHIKGMI